jgi:hypothetical protein
MEEKGIPSLITFGFVALFSTMGLLALLISYLVLFGG